tara:strand:- start:4220 stop:4999 length:780 start_codon:yes stop_codon:yes gene_type:complete
MDLGLKNKKVLVTGGTGELGNEICNHFLKEGSKVFVISRGTKNLKNKKKLSKIISNKINFFIADLTKEKEIEKILSIFKKNRMNFDVIVHNLGGSLGVKQNNSPIKLWKKVWDLNVGAAISLNNYFLSSMKNKKWGRIVHISSNGAENSGNQWQPAGGSAPYSASKSFLNNYISNLGREYAKHGIVVTGVMPGIISNSESGWQKMKLKKPKAYKNYINNFIPIGRFANPSEIAPFVLFLSSKQASYASSSIIRVDGGSL